MLSLHPHPPNTVFGRTAPPQPLPPLPPQTLLSQPAQCNQQQRGPEEPSQVYRPTWRGGRHGPENIPCSAAQVHILSLLEHIKQQQDQLVAKVNHLSSRVLNTSTPQEPECPECIQLPIESLEAVDELESFLKDAANAAAKQRMISSLATIGGQDVNRVAWNILSQMFKEDVAKNISWKGANGKRAFGHMSSKKLIEAGADVPIYVRIRKGTVAMSDRIREPPPWRIRCGVQVDTVSDPLS
ncbi:uncharacterized protein LOC143742416 [Siphateles boraxobius]|uniref:uncharacterized protein LOC143742416 n=1 Tax=Siphateles boraxobius TaxID=180520 RepID=UPI004062E5F6